MAGRPDRVSPSLQNAPGMQGKSITSIRSLAWLSVSRLTCDREATAPTRPRRLAASITERRHSRTADLAIGSSENREVPTTPQSRQPPPAQSGGGGHSKPPRRWRPPASTASSPARGTFCCATGASPRSSAPKVTSVTGLATCVPCHQAGGSRAADRRDDGESSLGDGAVVRRAAEGVAQGGAALVQQHIDYIVPPRQTHLQRARATVAALDGQRSAA